jgi:hypothetical protein
MNYVVPSRTSYLVQGELSSSALKLFNSALSKAEMSIERDKRMVMHNVFESSEEEQMVVYYKVS